MRVRITRLLSLIHPLMFALWPVFYLATMLPSRFWATQAVKPALVTMTIILGALLAVSPVFHSIARSAIVVSIGFLLTMISAPAYDEVSTNLSWFRDYNVYPYVLLVLLGVVLLIAYRVRKWRPDGVRKLGSVLGVMSVTLLCMPVFTNRANVSSWLTWEPEKPISSLMAHLDEGRIARKPHVFYLILDTYAREDVLRDLYGLDNSGFTKWLESKGFFVASKATANYPNTRPSIASSLNASYLPVHPIDARQEAECSELIANSEVASFLRMAGYRYVTLSSGYLDFELNRADQTLTPTLTVTEFDTHLFQMTPLARFSVLPFDTHRNRISHNFDVLPQLAESSEPVFVFAHFLVPHGPFVFDADGAPVRGARPISFGEGYAILGEGSTEEYANNYTGQLKYVTARIKQTISDILAVSVESPIIIIQSDHGPEMQLVPGDIERSNLWERYSILNAYHLPDDGDEMLYESISPVNTFRVIFNHYFGTDLRLLPDESFFQSNNPSASENWINVTDRIRRQSP